MLEMFLCLSKIISLFLLLYSFLLSCLKVVIVKKYDKTVVVYYCTDYPQFSFLFPEALFSALGSEGLNLGREHSHLTKSYESVIFILIGAKEQNIYLGTSFMLILF